MAWILISLAFVCLAFYGFYCWGHDTGYAAGRKEGSEAVRTEMRMAAVSRGFAEWQVTKAGEPFWMWKQSPEE